MSSLAYLPSSPTLFNSGTSHPQMSSCFLVDSPLRRPRLHLRPVRAGRQADQVLRRHRHRLVAGPLPRRADPRHQRRVQRDRAVPEDAGRLGRGGEPGRPAQGRRLRLPRALAPRHRGVPRARDNTGEEARRTHNLNLANWIPDVFMRRVEADEPWSLFDPDEVPELPDLWGEAFDAAYREAEAAGRYVRQVKARELYGRMMRTLAQTGNGWMTFKDASNAKCNQTADGGQRGAPVEPVHRDHRGDHRRRDRRLQPRLDQPRQAPDRPGRGRRAAQVDWDKLAQHRAHRGAVPRPGHRPELLPERAGGGVEPALAAGRPGRDGPAGRLLRAAAAVRLAARRASCPPGSPRRST